MKSPQRNSLDEHDPKDRPDPEVLEKPTRRRFTREYKWSILEQAAACTEPGEIGALLRREGLYDSLLYKWRRSFEAAGKKGLEPKKRGPAPRSKEDVVQLKELKRLQQENARLELKLKQAELIIDVQKKVSELLGIVLPTTPSDENT